MVAPTTDRNPPTKIYQTTKQKTMNTDYRYQLETPKLTGRRQQKTSCPSCGKKKCFVRYVDTQNAFCGNHRWD